MKRVIGIMLLTLFTAGLWLPSNASAAPSPQIYIQTQRRYSDRYRERRREMRRRQQMSYYGYRNYGQYRRTQVGNRRWRWQHRTYYRNGYPYTRRTRSY